ncbi:MAG: hypothetical protein IKF78_15095 [Atopobiaceae bacterium]|nr:hypothetical protein [Atopobiaceae bacterium]
MGAANDSSQKTSVPDSLVPERYRVLSGSVLKLIAIATMLVDHVTKRLLIRFPTYNTPLYFVGKTGVSWAVIGESIGRLAFPIFAFLLVEGFVHTRDRWRYGRNLALFALISEVPFDLSRMLTPFDPSYQNVFVTLFVSYVALCAYEGFADRPALRAACVLGLALASMGLACDYGPRGFALVFVFYVLRSNALAYTAVGSCIMLSTWRSALALVPINLYNGKRGFVQGPVLKFAFYAFYPVHLLVLWQMELQLIGA